MSLTYAFDTARSSQPAVEDDTPELAVKYPLLYQVSKDGRTHYVLGHIHSVPLEAMPLYVKDTIANCNLLLSEGIVDFPEGAQAKLFHQEPTKNSFLHLLDDLTLQRLKADLRPILEIRGITECALENISGTLLHQLFKMNIMKRMVKAIPAIDEALISLFKQSHKPIFELNKAVDIDLFWKYCTDSDAEACQNMSIDPEDEDSYDLLDRARSALHTNAQEIKDYYQNKIKRIERIQKIEQQFMCEDLDSDINRQQLIRELKEQALFIETTYAQENKAWLTLFTELHQQGTDGMLLASGYMHVLGDETSLLQLLENQGFSIARVTAPEVTFENQFARLSLK